MTTQTTHRKSLRERMEEAEGHAMVLPAIESKTTKRLRWESGPISLVVKKAYINADGDIGRATLKVGEQTIDLTFPQARALAQELARRCL